MQACAEEARAKSRRRDNLKPAALQAESDWRAGGRRALRAKGGGGARPWWTSRNAARRSSAPAAVAAATTALAATATATAAFPQVDLTIPRSAGPLLVRVEFRLVHFGTDFI
eukprot:879435-Prorocentrum_minimum.AAC.2